MPAKTVLVSAFLLIPLLPAQEPEAPPARAPTAVEEEEKTPAAGAFREDHRLSLDGKRVPLAESALAAQVLTGEELRALGVHTLPEAFRYVPGLDVFQLNGFTYAVGIRGVDDEFNPRIHVYLDGRLVNVAEFGGVDWESIPVAVDDIDRIEILRGAGIPGEGGHSLNGSIRIWTRKPAQVPRFTYSGYEGWPENHIHFARAGGAWGPFSAKAGLEYRRDDGIAGVNSAGLDDGQRLVKFNLHGGWEISKDTDLSVRFAGVSGQVEETNGLPISNGDTNTENYSLTAALDHLFKNGIRLSGSYSFEAFALEVKDFPLAPVHQAGSDIDLERTTHTLFAAARFPVRPNWDLTASGGFKEDRLVFERNSPQSSDQELLHFHLGAEGRPLTDVFLNAGLGIERDLRAGVALSPDLGLAYRFLPEQTLRASYRVGQRRPTFTETRLGFLAPNPVPPPLGLPLITGDPDLDWESVRAYEAGYHGAFQKLGLLVDGQLFYHELKDKVEFVPDPTSPVPVALTFENQGRETGMGAELFAEWRVRGPLSLHGTYTYQTYEATRGDDRRLKHRPRHKANLGPRVHFREGPLKGVSALVNLNWVSEIEQADLAGVEHRISDRFRLDFRIAKTFWKERLELALIGRNVLDNETLEFRPPLGSNSDGAFGAERMFLINLLLKL